MSIALILLLASAATPLSPPPTPIKEVIEHVHTRPIADPYRWLEQLDDPAVMPWARAQHAYTKSMLQTETRTYKGEQNQQRPQEIAIDANLSLIHIYLAAPGRTAPYPNTNQLRGLT